MTRAIRGVSYRKDFGISHEQNGITCQSGRRKKRQTTYNGKERFVL